MSPQYLTKKITLATLTITPEGTTKHSLAFLQAPRRHTKGALFFCFRSSSS
jgi:hypothetical protein